MTMRTDTNATRPDGARDGFSLVEVLVAILILVVGVIAMASVSAPIRALQIQSQMQLEMSHVAHSKMEELRALAEGKQFGTALSVGGGVDSTYTGYHESAAGEGVRSYSVRWRIDDGPSRTFHVTVRVVPTTQSKYDPGPMDFQTRMVDR